MLLSGLLHVMLPAGFIRRRFQGFSGVFQAVAFGVPLPLCSCGVVPAGIGLKNDGASDGASVGFLISTPQTGVDSVLVCMSFFGWPFAIFKMVSAFVLGVIGGCITERFPDSKTNSEGGSSTVASCCSHDHAPDNSTGVANSVWQAIKHSVEILRSIWLWLVVGILISAAIEIWVPPTWFQSVGEMGLLPAMLLVLLVSVPLYVCATASVPIAAVLIAQGLPPAAALVFLMAGPATNMTTIGAIFGRFGWRVLFTYLATIVVGSMLCAFLFDWMIPTAILSDAGHAGHHHANWFAYVCSVALLALFAYFVFERLKKRLQPRRKEILPSLSDERVQLKG